MSHQVVLGSQLARPSQGSGKSLSLCFPLGPGRLFPELTEIAATSYSCRVFDAQVLPFPPSLIHCREEVCSLQVTFANSQRGTWGSNWGCSLPKSAPCGTWQVSSVRQSVLADKCSSFVVSFKPQHKPMKQIV